MSMKIDEWRGIIAECKKSGLPQREYCRTKKISYPTFSYWRTKINKIGSPSPHESESPFVRRTLPSVNSTAYVLEWPDGMKLRMPIHLSPEGVSDLVKSLRFIRS